MALPIGSLPLAGEFLHRHAKLVGVHGLDDLLFLGIELLSDRRCRGLIDQRLGAADRRRRVLRQSLGEFLRRDLQLCCRTGVTAAW